MCGLELRHLDMFRLVPVRHFTEGFHQNPWEGWIRSGVVVYTVHTGVSICLRWSEPRRTLPQHPPRSQSRCHRSKHHPRVPLHLPDSLAQNFWQQHLPLSPRELGRISRHQWHLSSPCSGCSRVALVMISSQHWAGLRASFEVPPMSSCGTRTRHRSWPAWPGSTAPWRQ